MDDEHLYAAALALTQGIGWKLINRLLEQFSTLKAILAASTSDLQSVKGIGKQIATRVTSIDLDKLAPELKTFQESGITILTWFDDGYPQAFRTLENRPLILFVRGQIPTDDKGCISIVGTRTPVPVSAKIAESWAAGFAERGWTVVSGLARGIDTLAHLGALRAGGRSIAVLGCGINQIYPPENRSLATKLINCGAVMSEFHPATNVMNPNLILRNRLITALSRATIVMEAGLDSGAFNAAQQANDQKRPVFAPDNSPGNKVILEQFARPLPPDVDTLIQMVS